MSDQRLLKTAIKLANSNRNGRLQAEKIFLDHLSMYSQDTDVRIMLALLLCGAPWADEDGALANLNLALSYETDPIKRAHCLLLMAYMQQHMFGIQKELYEQISSLSISDSTILAILEIAKAWYHGYFKKSDLYEQALQKSIEYDNTIARNYYELGKFYIEEKNDYKKGTELIRKAIANVKKVYTDPENFTKIQKKLTPHEKNIYTNGFSDLDDLSLKQFLDERYKMSEISDSVYGFMKEYLC